MAQWSDFSHRAVTARDRRDPHWVIFERLTHSVEKRARIGQILFSERIFDCVLAEFADRECDCGAPAQASGGD
jgi:hypothetical protein